MSSNKDNVNVSFCSEEEKTSSFSLSAELKDYYVHQGLDLANVVQSSTADATADAPLLRFIRLNPRYQQNETLSLLKEEINNQKGDNDTNVGIPFRAIPWLDETLGFYAVPGNFSLQKSNLFRSGRIYGMDVSSGAAVAVLLSSQYDVDVPATALCDNKTTNASIDISSQTSNDNVDCFRVLDLCCAPGLKLCAVADVVMGMVGMPLPSAVRIVGVDVSESRLAVCKHIITKYHVDPDTCGSEREKGDGNNSMSIQLYCGDGRTFGTRHQDLDLQFDSNVEAEEHSLSGNNDNNNNGNKRKRKNKSARARRRKRLRQLANEEMTAASETPQELQSSSSDPDNHVIVPLFDRVLVDAECSTDGSLKHVLKRSSKQQQDMKSGDKSTAGNDPTSLPSLTNANELSKLVKLQQDLIMSGFRLLKPGGYMVYSTCSLSEDQNEKVVAWLLQQVPNDEAFLVPVKFPDQDEPRNSFVSQGSLAGTVRFQPNPQSFASHATETLHDDFAHANLFGGGFFLAKLGKVGL